ncbi:hypothetical protein K491DRAFT_763465 [Lophiostoma macrostomum CBS 122681]|uniref:Autophagy-related protein 16 domain-containing protein n=1 Tax=Lophiostoma macrostomum CBS 122681 TaxID=1314788 RepID=A0A6A6SJS3_9PLEO|nr:hypothetical protein K491DRAFT_763465 [Lophiostoma macrostomum CBS 122681]
MPPYSPNMFSRAWPTTPPNPPPFAPSTPSKSARKRAIKPSPSPSPEADSPTKKMAHSSMDDLDTSHTTLLTQNRSLQSQIQTLKASLQARDAIESRASDLAARVRRLEDDKAALAAEVARLEDQDQGNRILELEMHARRAVAREVELEKKVIRNAWFGE